MSPEEHKKDRDAALGCLGAFVLAGIFWYFVIRTLVEAF